MLARYRIVRGKRPPGEPLPRGIRKDTRKHTRHVLRPTDELVERFLSLPSAPGFSEFRAGYLALLRQRFERERQYFDEIAALARQGDVYLGCNCPTTKQPDVNHCHTVLALEFFVQHYPDLDVRRP